MPGPFPPWAMQLQAGTYYPLDPLGARVVPCRGLQCSPLALECSPPVLECSPGAEGEPLWALECSGTSAPCLIGEVSSKGSPKLQRDMINQVESTLAQQHQLPTHHTYINFA